MLKFAAAVALLATAVAAAPQRRDYTPCAPNSFDNGEGSCVCAWGFQQKADNTCESCTDLKLQYQEPMGFPNVSGTCVQTAQEIEHETPPAPTPLECLPTWDNGEGVQVCDWGRVPSQSDASCCVACKSTFVPGNFPDESGTCQ